MQTAKPQKNITSRFEPEMKHPSQRNFGAIEYPANITSDEAMGYIRYDIYPHKSQQYGEEAIPAQSLGNINLHMPAEITDSIEAEWSAEEDVISKAVDATAGAKKLADRVTAQGQNWAQMGRQIAVSGLTVANQFSEKLGELIPGLGVGTKGIMRRAGLATNPNEMHFFKGVSYRTFSYTHKLIAFSEEDSENIRRILHLFKYHSAPNIDDEMKNHFLYPGEFHIGFYNKDLLNTYLPQIWGCVCTQVEINYTGSSTWSQFPSGAPTDVEIQLSFQETVLPTKGVIHQEYENWKTHNPATLNADHRNKQIFIERDRNARTGFENIDRGMDALSSLSKTAIAERVENKR